jgi:hypothetical protein
MEKIVEESKLVIKNNSEFSLELTEKIQLLNEEEKNNLTIILKEYVREISEEEWILREKYKDNWIEPKKLSDDDFYNMINNGLIDI